MAQTSYPFTASTITQAQWQSMAKLFGSTGIAPNIGTELLVTAAGTTMTVVVGIGSALVEGFFYNTDATITLTIAAANASNPRIDTIALRMDRTANTVTAVVVAGTAAASPSPPTLNSASTLFDFPLADVLVGAAVGVIASGAVTDRRVTSGPRGAVVGLSDTQTLTNKTFTSPVLNTPTGVARGTVAQVTAASPSTSTTLSPTLLAEITIITASSFTYDAARRYRVNATLRAGAGAANQNLSFRIYMGASLVAASDAFLVGTGAPATVVVTGNFTGLSGAASIFLAGTHTGGSAATPGNASGGYVPIQLWVEDIGV